MKDFPKKFQNSNPKHQLASYYINTYDIFSQNQVDLAEKFPGMEPSDWEANTCQNKCALYTFPKLEYGNNYGHIICYTAYYKTQITSTDDCTHYKHDSERRYNFQTYNHYISSNSFKLFGCSKNPTFNKICVFLDKKFIDYRFLMDKLLPISKFLLFLLAVLVVFLIGFYWLIRRKMMKDKFGFVRYKNVEQFYLIGEPMEGTSANIYPCWLTVKRKDGNENLEDRIKHIEVSKVALKHFKDSNLNELKEHF